MIDLRSQIGLQAIGNPPVMRRVNGIGPSIAGGFDEPLAPGYFYKQFVFTFLYFPIFLGVIYLVSGNRDGYSFAGKIPFPMFLRRFGFGGYLKLLFTVLLEGCGLLIVLLVALGFAYGVVWLLRGLF